MTTETATKEKPILFSSEMVRAILDGRKTQTRRVVKPQPEYIQDDGRIVALQDMSSSVQRRVTLGQMPSRCPYGQPGDRLWVRETWTCTHGIGEAPNQEDLVLYRADAGEAEQVITDARAWRPSIFMPRAYSRITLEIESVRVERLQAISEEDAKAEGVEPNWSGDLDSFDPELHGYLGVNRGDGEDEEGYYRTARDAFAELWNSINAKRGYDWESDPYVWIVGFRRVQP